MGSVDPWPRVSVIVPCHNLGMEAERLVSALLAQDHPAELVFVDDGSTDETSKRLGELLSGITSARVVTHGKNRGRAAARNTGVAVATGEVLLFLDDDMEPEPDFVRAHAEEHLRPEVVGVISVPMLEGLDLDEPYHQYLKDRHGAAGLTPGEPVPFRYFIIGYTSVKARVVQAVGGFDERFSYGEDIDFAYRLAQRYPDGLFVSRRAIVHHYDHGTLDDRLAKLRTFGRENLPLLLDKHPGIATAANLDFVEPATSLLFQVKHLALSLVPASTLRGILLRIPRPLRSVAVRYLMAATIAEAYRESLRPGV